MPNRFIAERLCRIGVRGRSLARHLGFVLHFFVVPKFFLNYFLNPKFN